MNQNAVRAAIEYVERHRSALVMFSGEPPG